MPFKRLQHIVLSIVALVVLFPLLLLVALAIVIDSPGASPIFVQTRVGLNGKKFKFYKFRTMVPNADQLLEKLMSLNEMDGPVFKIKNDPRITRVGHFIRRTSIDELPQLINILKGDMSIVGPRPLLVKYLPRYTETQRRRHDVRPGLTGYAQINGRNAISWEERFAYDVEYVDNITFIGDVKIIFATVKAVFKRSGITSGTSATMEEFMGSES